MILSAPTATMVIRSVATEGGNNAPVRDTVISSVSGGVTWQRGIYAGNSDILATTYVLACKVVLQNTSQLAVL